MKKKRIVKLEPQTVELFAEVLSKLRPPPPLTVSQWADRYRVLSAESSAEPGRWHTEKAPYQRAIMDAIGDPHVRSVVVMSAAQIGKTDAFILNPLGYYMDYGDSGDYEEKIDGNGSRMGGHRDSGNCMLTSPTIRKHITPQQKWKSCWATQNAALLTLSTSSTPSNRMKDRPPTSPPHPAAWRHPAP